MKLELEQQDIEAIAGKVAEQLLPLLQGQLRQEDDILDLDAVSLMLGKSKGQVYQWVSDSSHGLNDFPFMKAGRALRFSKKALVQWMSKAGRTGNNG
jgi:predicted DNA-binding transcriptional regulator AlpA